jgi:hypothetical protein
MRYLFLVLTIFFTTVYANYIPKEYEIIGTGIHSNLEVARNYAKSQIASSLKSRVKSETIQKTKQDGENFNQKFVNNIKSTSADIDLNDLKEIEVKIKNGKYHVKLAYDKRTLLQKIKAKDIKPSDIDINNQLYKTELVSSIFKKMGFQFPISLIRRNSSWYFEVGNSLFFLNSEDFKKLFFKSDKNIKLDLNQNNFRHDDKMFFSIKSKNSGFVSILYSEQDGKVGVLAQNIKIKANTDIEYPSNLDEDDIIVYNPEGKKFKEFYVAIFSNNQLDLSTFDEISDINLDKTNYKFDKLLSLMSLYDYSTGIVKIK